MTTHKRTHTHTAVKSEVVAEPKVIRTMMQESSEPKFIVQR